MISTKELKGQLDELTEQQQFLTQQLEQIKQLLQKQNDNQSQNQNQNKLQNQGGQPQSNQGQSNDSGSNSQNQSGNNGNQITSIANEFLKLKGLTSSLENKMRQYTSNNSSGSSLKEEDVINLILNMMNGMIDWTIEYVSKQSGQSDQSQQQ